MFICVYVLSCGYMRTCIILSLRFHEAIYSKYLNDKADDKYDTPFNNQYSTHSHSSITPAKQDEIDAKIIANEK